MRRRLITLLLLAAACGSSPSADPAKAARALVDAAAAGDVDRATALLPAPAVCDALEASFVDRCRSGLAEARAELPALIGELRGMKVVSVEKLPADMPDPSWSLHEVRAELAGDSERFEIVTVVHGGRAYATFPIKRKVQAP